MKQNTTHNAPGGNRQGPLEYRKWHIDIGKGT